MNLEQKQLIEILDRAWGTIGPKSLEAGKALASYCGVQYGLTLFSASVALEAALRGQNIGYGDQIIMAAYGDPLESMTTALVGATPVFADIDPETLTLTAETAEAKLTVYTRAIIMGLQAGNTAHVKAVAELCREKGLLFILNLDDAFGAQVEGEPVAKLSDLSIINMAEGKLLDVGLAVPSCVRVKRYSNSASPFITADVHWAQEAPCPLIRCWAAICVLQSGRPA